MKLLTNYIDQHPENAGAYSSILGILTGGLTFMETLEAIMPILGIFSLLTGITAGIISIKLTLKRKKIKEIELREKLKQRENEESEKKDQ